MASVHVLILFAAFYFQGVAGAGPAAENSAAGDAGERASGACTILGYQPAAQASTPAYVPGETARRSELGAMIAFPTAALGYDPATQRFSVLLPATSDAPETDRVLVELRRKHVAFEGDACPGQAQSGGSIRCFEATTLASRGSNPVYCQRQKNPSE